MFDRHKSCRHCGKLACYAHCQEDDDGKHEADSSFLSVADVTPPPGTVIVDINCRRCGVSGSMTVELKDILWE